MHRRSTGLQLTRGLSQCGWVKEPTKEEPRWELLAVQDPELPLQGGRRGYHGSNDVGGQMARCPFLLVAVGEQGPCDTVHRVWPPRTQAGGPGTAATRHSHGQKSRHESIVTMAVTVAS